MKTIKVKTQVKFDSLPTFFKKETEIKIIGEIREISTTIENTFFSVSGNGTIVSIFGNGTVVSIFGNGRVDSIYGNGRVEAIYGNGRVGCIFDNGTVSHVFENSIVNHIFENGTVKSISGNGRVGFVSINSKVGSVSGNGTVESVSKNGTVGSVSGNGVVGSVSGNGVVGSVSGNGTVAYVSGSGVVEYASGNSVVHLFSPTAKVLEADQQATIIYRGCEGAPAKCADTVNILHLQKTGFTLQDFIKIYRVETSNGKLLLYKFVQTDFTDSYLEKIKYEVGTVVECSNWNDDINVECGSGLYLSSSVASCRRFNSSSSGHVLKCEVDPVDILVHPEPVFPQKVRCRKVKVLEEVI